MRYSYSDEEKTKHSRNGCLQKDDENSLDGSSKQSNKEVLMKMPTERKNQGKIAEILWAYKEEGELGELKHNGAY